MLRRLSNYYILLYGSPAEAKPILFIHIGWDCSGEIRHVLIKSRENGIDAKRCVSSWIIPECQASGRSRHLMRKFTDYLVTRKERGDESSGV
jgi:hypothetical protein